MSVQNSAWQLSGELPGTFPCWRGPRDEEIGLHQLLVALPGWQAQRLGGKCHPQALLECTGRTTEFWAPFLGTLSLQGWCGAEFLLWLQSPPPAKRVSAQLDETLHSQLWGCACSHLSRDSQEGGRENIYTDLRDRTEWLQSD